MNHRPVVATVGVEGTNLQMAMVKLVEMALDKHPDFDRLVVFEQDVTPPPDAFNRIAQYEPEHDIVGAMTFRHEPPHHIMAMMRTGGTAFSPITAEVTRNMVENPGLYEVDAVAMGFTAISRRVFEQWDPAVPMWRPTPPLIGHDLHFCTEAKKRGFHVFVDSGIRCGHLTLMPIGYEESQDALADAPPTPEVWV